MYPKEFIRGLSCLQDSHRGCVMTIGSFDGVHLGHQRLLNTLKQKAVQLGLPSLVMIFEPQPHEFFKREKAPARLMRLREKVTALHEHGIDRVLCVRFNKAFRNLSAQAFIDRILVAGLGVRHIEIGDDFRFGCDRKGDFKALLNAGQHHGFSVSHAQTLILGGQRVSSTRIRKVLEQDHFDEVESLLGEPFSIAGRVIYGKQLGRTINVPTANVGLCRHRCPVKGVYIVSVYWGGRYFDGVANVGVRPTVEGGVKPLLETHLFDFNENLYGDCIRVIFKKKLREEKHFAGFEQLVEQIHHDISAAKLFLNI